MDEQQQVQIDGEVLKAMLGDMAFDVLAARSAMKTAGEMIRNQKQTIQEMEARLPKDEPMPADATE